MEAPAEAVRIVKAMEKKDTSSRGLPEDLQLGDDVYLLLERNELGQLTKVPSLNGSLSIRRGSEGRVVGLPDGRADAVEVEFFEQGTGLFARHDLAKTEGVEIDQQGLSRVLDLLQALQRDLPNDELEVSIVAIMGKFRQGKSFLLNLLVQYFQWLEVEWLQQTGVNDEGALVSPGSQGDTTLYFCGRQPGEGTGACLLGGKQCPACQRFQAGRAESPAPRAAPTGDPSWWEADQLVPHSFKVQRQTETCTKGIEIYPRPFLLRRAGKQTAVLLMDSQGAFDGMINEKQSQTILALTTVLASTVIYNLKGNIGEENIRHTTDVANFVTTALSLTPDTTGDAKEGPLGHLSFLLRDFDYPYADGRRDEEVSWDVRVRMAEEDLNRFEREVATLKGSFRSVRLSWMCHPGDEVEQGRGAVRLGGIRQLFMQLLDEYVWHSFESGKFGFPFPSRSIFDGTPLTANNLAAHLENLRKVLFDCDLKMAPPRWMATQLMKKSCDEFKCSVEQLLIVKLPAIRLEATGFGGYYTSDLDDFYTVTKLVQLQDRVISTSEKCPGDASTGTVSGSAVNLLGSTGTLVGDEIRWSGAQAGCLQLCAAPAIPQVWVRQALTREQVAAAENELCQKAEQLKAAETELERLRRRAEDMLQQRLDSFREQVAQMLRPVQGELQGFLRELRQGLLESLDARAFEVRARIAQQEAEAATRRGELAAQRERIAVLETKMLKAELQHVKGVNDLSADRRRDIHTPHRGWGLSMWLTDWCLVPSRCDHACCGGDAREPGAREDRLGMVE
mmetsp:Transcript_46965/g.134028  ORF Transcript_46965/g.134028 Transcript_46965/m.134028 type:complete len:789 (-) Transcript_46965:230-2596(-)